MLSFRAKGRIFLYIYLARSLCGYFRGKTHNKPFTSHTATQRVFIALQSTENTNKTDRNVRPNPWTNTHEENIRFASVVRPLSIFLSDLEKSCPIFRTDGKRRNGETSVTKRPGQFHGGR